MDLSTRYLGLSLPSPIVVSASPVTMQLAETQQAVDAGAGAVVMYSLFEEKIKADELRDMELAQQNAGVFGEAPDGFFPEGPALAYGGATPSLRHVERLAGGLNVPVIASLNGSSRGGWTQIATRMQDAGASALELNIYAVPGRTSQNGADVEKAHVEILQAVLAAVSIPVAVKLSPFFSSTASMAKQLDDAGAAGLVLFNRFLPPDIDIETLRTTAGLQLSSPVEGKLPRSWIAILRRQVKASLAGSSGVETADDVIAYLLAGADVVMTASALLRHGPAYVGELRRGLESWLDRKHLSLDQARARLSVPPAGAANLQRAGYVHAIEQAGHQYGSLTH